MRVFAHVSRHVTPPAPLVLIAIASWDSPSLVVFSYPAPPTANVKDGKPENRKRAGKLPDRSGAAAAENIATWLPPWGGSVDAAERADALEGGGTACLTRALAFVQFGTGSGGLSLVAATGDGAVAVAEWQGGDGEWRTGHKTTGDKSFSKGNLETAVSFQIGRGAVRLEAFQPAGLVAEEGRGVETGGGNGERLFVNGDTMDAIVRLCIFSGQQRCRWQCTQVGFASPYKHVERLRMCFFSLQIR